MVVLRHSMDRDTLRLWTTDQDFHLKKIYMSYDKLSPKSGIGASFKFIHQTTGGIYLADDNTDTIYKFSETKIEPQYVFDFNRFNYSRRLTDKKLEKDEVVGLVTIVTDNVILRRVFMNDKYYLIYYNRKERFSKTIDHFTGGPDLISIARGVSSDDYSRLYWNLFPFDSSSFIGFPDLLSASKQGGPFFIVSHLK